MKRKDIFYYTKRKIIGISVIIVFVCLLIFALITQFLYSSRLFSDIDKQLIKQRNIMLNISPRIANNTISMFSDEIFFRNPPPIPQQFIIIIYGEDKAVFISPNAYFNKDTYPYILDISNNEIQKVDYQGNNFRGIRFRQNSYDVQMLINVDSELQSIKQLRNSITIGLILLIIIALVLSAILASRILRPVRENYDKQVFFVQDASHEMRTPLAVIKGKLELLAKSRDDTIDNNFEHISKIMSEVVGMEKLNNKLLLLTKEDIDFNVNVTKVELSKFVEYISEFYFDLAEMQNKEFQVKKPESEIILQWDNGKMKQVLIILLENAFKYTPEKGKILLSFEEINKNIKIIVSDNGIGIKEEDQLRIFDRFFRSSDVRAKNIGGSGIGLSLLKSICKSLGITIKFSSIYGKGTEFKLSVPKKMKE